MMAELLGISYTADRTKRQSSGSGLSQRLEINALRQVTKAVVEAARESLVIGQG